MNDGKYFGLTPAQLNLAFFAVVGAVALAGFVYFGGVGAVKEYLGEEPTPPAAVVQATPEPTFPDSPPQTIEDILDDGSELNEFISEGLRSGATERQMTCLWNLLRARFSLSEVMEIDRLETGTPVFWAADVLRAYGDDPTICSESAQATFDTPTTMVQGSQCSQLMLGCDAVVTNTGTWLNVRDAPTINGAIVGRLEDGMTVLIVGDRVESDGYRWWQIESAGPAGWAVEGDKDGTAWLIPSFGSSDAQGSASDGPSLADTANEPSYCQELAETRAELEADGLWEYVKSQLEFSPNGPFLKECSAWGD